MTPFFNYIRDRLPERVEVFWWKHLPLTWGVDRYPDPDAPGELTSVNVGRVEIVIWQPRARREKENGSTK
jgi:hypothetical protein